MGAREQNVTTLSGKVTIEAFNLGEGKPRRIVLRIAAAENLRELGVFGLSIREVLLFARWLGVMDTAPGDYCSMGHHKGAGAGTSLLFLKRQQDAGDFTISVSRQESTFAEATLSRAQLFTLGEMMLQELMALYAAEGALAEMVSDLAAENAGKETIWFTPEEWAQFEETVVVSRRRKESSRTALVITARLLIDRDDDVEAVDAINELLWSQMHHRKSDSPLLDYQVDYGQAEEFTLTDSYQDGDAFCRR